MKRSDYIALGLIAATAVAVYSQRVTPEMNKAEAEAAFAAGTKLLLTAASADADPAAFDAAATRLEKAAGKPGVETTPPKYAPLATALGLEAKAITARQKLSPKGTGDVGSGTLPEGVTTTIATAAWEYTPGSAITRLPTGTQLRVIARLPDGVLRVRRLGSDVDLYVVEGDTRPTRPGEPVQELPLVQNALQFAPYTVVTAKAAQVWKKVPPASGDLVVTTLAPGQTLQAVGREGDFLLIERKDMFGTLVARGYIVETTTWRPHVTKGVVAVYDSGVQIATVGDLTRLWVLSDHGDSLRVRPNYTGAPFLEGYVNRFQVRPE